MGDKWTQTGSGKSEASRKKNPTPWGYFREPHVLDLTVRLVSIVKTADIPWPKCEVLI